MKITTACLLFALVVIITITGCSSEKENLVTPSNDTTNYDFSNVISDESESERSFLGSWSMEFDPDSLQLNVAQIREPSGHWNLTTLISQPSFQIVSYDPIFGIVDVNATITNPYALNGYDLRMIVYTDATGNRLLNYDNRIFPGYNRF